MVTPGSDRAGETSACGVADDERAMADVGGPQLIGAGRDGVELEEPVDVGERDPRTLHASLHVLASMSADVGDRQP
jgi:hypothetical protein